MFLILEKKGGGHLSGFDPAEALYVPYFVVNSTDSNCGDSIVS